jgi:hypothetical protein
MSSAVSTPAIPNASSLAGQRPGWNERYLALKETL